MEVLTANIAGKIEDFTVKPIERQVEYLLSYKKICEDLDGKIRDLTGIKVRIENGVEEEKRNGRDIEEDVISWQKSVDETLEAARKLCSRAQTHASVWYRCWKWSFPNLISRHQLGRKAKKISSTITGLQIKGKFDGGLGHVTFSGISNSIFSNQGSEKLKSRNSLKKEVLLALTDPKVSKVGIYGWGGVGKTTLAKEVAKHAKDDKLFDLVAMATISQTMDVKKVQNDIAWQLGFDQLDEKIPIEGRADRLYRRITMGKNILIILDDLWEKIDLDKIGIPTEQDLKGGKLSLTSKRLDISKKNETYQGCKLLLTSRRLDILQKNEIQMSFSLEALNNAESWTLFEDMVDDAIKDAGLQKIATQIVERCAGLPVMIVSIAKSLKYNKNIYYWKDALNNLKRVDGGDMHENVFVTFEFTYNRLEDEMKKVFLLCGLHGPSMCVSDLLKYAIGLGVFKYIDTVEDARNRLYRIIDGLKASCLLLEDDASETDVIKVHDLVREVALSLAKKNEHAFVFKSNDMMQDWPRKGLLERCTQIIIQTRIIQKLPQKLDCPNLKFFHLSLSDNCTLEIPDSFFEVVGSLEALDLTGLVISSLPKSVVCLTKLKTLCLDQCILKHMAGIGSLINLEILSFIYSFMKEFPSEIGQLTRLRMLDLRNSKVGIISPDIFSKLTKIEELYMGNASIKWEEESSIKQNRSSSLATLGCLTSVTTLEIQIREAGMLSRDLMFDKLERYKVLIGDEWGWLGNNRNLRLLKLKLHTSIHLEHGIKALIKRVEDLYLDEVNGISDVLFQLNAKGFPLLKHLHIQNDSQLQHIINTMERNNETCVLFPELETLSLHNLNNLVKICHGPLYDNSFRKLTVIKVESCDQLVYLFHVLILNALSQLLELEVSKCSSMKRIVLIENDDGGMTSDDKIEFHSLHSLSLYHLPAIQDFCSNEFTSCMTAPSLFNGIKVSFSSLETLKLSSINLEKIWDDDEICAANSIHNLASLIVEDCRGLKHLFSYSAIGSLSKLKHLEISRCEMMEEIIAPKGKNNIALEEVRFSKLETLVIKDMKRLKNVWHFQFESLKTLEVSNCGRLTNIFPFELQGTFGSLETLKVHLPNLETIIIEGMPELKTIWHPFFTSSCLDNLKMMQVSNCEKLESIFPSYMQRAFASLETLMISDCNSVQSLFTLEEVTCNLEREGFQIDQVLDDLEYLLVHHCSKLKHLVPSTINFCQLTYLEVQNCNGLIHLITSSTAKSLVNLEIMIIRNCNSLEQVVAEDRVESEDAIAFCNLWVLELECLPRLKMFCSSSYRLLDLPWLYEVVISNCPRMEIFSLGKTDAPMLQEVLTQKEDEKEQWQGDLNTTVTKIFQDMADQVVDTTKQEIPNLPSSSDDRQQKENASSTDPQDAEESSIGTKEMYDTIKKPSISVAQNVPSSSSTMIPDAATMYPSPSRAPELAAGQITGLARGTRETGENVERPMVEAAKIALSPTGVCNAEGSQESETCPKENLFHQPQILVTCDKNEAVGSQEIRETLDKPLIQSDQHAQNLATIENTEKSRDSYIETQKISDTNKKPSSPTKQNVPNSTMISDIVAIDPSSSKSPQPMTSTILESDAYINDKWLNYISKQNLPYLEFGDCCASLEAIGFDASWLNYVYGCIESCGNGDELIRKLEETEAKASTLRNELASVELKALVRRGEAHEDLEYFEEGIAGEDEGRNDW
ncbi:hypothetical protein K1719_016760 [Acacia pycnantha]|nr:hypothetical protein K1719_016760 [Acacia pycnantha]